MFFMKFESIVYRTGSCSLATFFARCADNYSLPLVPRPPPVFLLLKCCSRGSKIVTVSAAVHETNFGVLLLFFGQCRVIHTVSPSLCSVSLKLHYLPIIKYTQVQAQHSEIHVVPCSVFCGALYYSHYYSH